MIQKIKTIYEIILSLDPLRKYEGETVTLELPGDMTIFNIDWLAIFDLDTNTNYGSVLIPDGLNVPPSLIKIQVHLQIINMYLKNKY